MEKAKIIAAIEAILFAVGNSVEKSRLLEVLEISKEELDEALETMKNLYEAEERGIELLFLEDSVQLGTKTEAYEYLTKIAKTPSHYVLTDTVLETLSIIAYKQPVTKAEIEKIRGVSCDHAVNKLLEFDLIEEVGRLEAPGRPMMFGTTEQFLRSFKVKSIGDLPKVSPELEEDFRMQATREVFEEEGTNIDADSDSDDDNITVGI